MIGHESPPTGLPSSSVVEVSVIYFTHLHYNLAIPLAGIYPKEMKATST